jgi:hypothetical protein
MSLRSASLADIEQDGPWMFSLVQRKLGPQGPIRLVVPQVLSEPILHIEGTDLEIVEFGEGESKHIAAVYIPALRALLSADLVYNHAHLYLRERHLESWLNPGHCNAAGLELIAQTRAYLHDFAEAIKSGDAKATERQMLAKYPQYHVRQFLSVFSVPDYFPRASSL